jgi:hypothetical protein
MAIISRVMRTRCVMGQYSTQDWGTSRRHRGKGLRSQQPVQQHHISQQSSHKLPSILVAQ